MTRIVIFSPAAAADIDGISLYIEHDSLDAAMRFQRQARSTCLELAEMPKKGRKLAGELARDLRRYPVRGCTNYLIFYRVGELSVEIIRVLHGARDIETVFEPEP
jgi:toxin ParE1/3/4